MQLGQNEDRHNLVNHNLNSVYTSWVLEFFKSRFTPYKVEQPLQGMELQEKETQKD